MDYECKSLSLLAPELDYLKGQNSEVASENSLLRSNMGKLEKQYHHITSEFRNKFQIKNEEKENFSARNEELVQRIKLVTKKMEERESERCKEQICLKDGLEAMKKEISEEKNKSFQELSNYRNELLRREEECHVFQLEN